MHTLRAWHGRDLLSQPLFAIAISRTSTKVDASSDTPVDLLECSCSCRLFLGAMYYCNTTGVFDFFFCRGNNMISHARVTRTVAGR